MSTTHHQLRALQLSSTRLEMRKRRVERLSRQGPMTLHASKRLSLQSRKKNGYAAYKLLMQTKEIALTLLRATNRVYYYIST
ncbi:hypothetical protein F383_12931 [Gossypium arboreum]|uniref:Uncharacterized protein n=1 Tax=Gossypium arboreum TaxID=29729 RepID=A0A0B0PYE4_GOSAR|nr:hypothetical protein F383_12931 [Gossypium arboreum]